MARVSNQGKGQGVPESIGSWAYDTARTTRRIVLRHLGVIAGTVAIASLSALISACIVTILAPRAVLTVLAMLLTLAVSALAGLRIVLAWIISASSNDALLLTLAALPLGALLVGSRLARNAQDSLRQV